MILICIINDDSINDNKSGFYYLRINLSFKLPVISSSTVSRKDKSKIVKKIMSYRDLSPEISKL